MPKTQQIGDDVFDVLRGVEWEGDIARITCGQLDRKLYERVNKVLEALGGRWNKKAKGHVFDGNAAEDLETALLIRSFTVNGHRQILQYFPTPEGLADKLVSAACLRPGHSVLEPSAGDGQLVRAIQRAEPNCSITAVEIDPKRAAKCGVGCIAADFMTWEPDAKLDRIVMNPPFTRLQDIDHVMRAYSMLKEGGILAAIMSTAWRHRTTKKAGGFAALVSATGWWEMLAPGAFSQSGTEIPTLMVVLNK